MIHGKNNPETSRVNIITLGCAKNRVDSEVLHAQLRGGGVDARHEMTGFDFDIAIINTCGFIEAAKEESIQTILEYVEAKNQGLIRKVYVTGCLSQRYREQLEREIPEVDGWYGTFDLPLLLNRFNVDYRHELIGERHPSITGHYAYMKISEGCNRTCSFCAIPIMRGKHRSRPLEELVDEARKLAARGVKELILIAQELTYYGLDIYKKRRLADLLQALSEVDGIEWIRLHYAYPARFPLDVLDVMRDNPRICKYLDMPLQHASNRVLKAMKRQITREETIRLIDTIRQKVPGIAIRTTMLVGFPGETDEDFTELMQFVEDMRFERLGVFTYSHEEGTSAYSLRDDVPEPVKQQRASALMELQQEIALQHNQAFTGSTLKVLIDRKESGYFIGRTEFDSPEVDNEVLIDAREHYLRVGDFAMITITSAGDYELYGIPAVKPALNS